MFGTQRPNDDPFCDAIAKIFRRAVKVLRGIQKRHEFVYRNVQDLKWRTMDGVDFVEEQRKVRSRFKESMV